jgi:hypothetical protein
VSPSRPVVPGWRGGKRVAEAREGKRLAEVAGAAVHVALRRLCAKRLCTRKGWGGEGRAGGHAAPECDLRCFSVSVWMVWCDAVG